MTNTVTDKQLSLLNHTLGLSEWNRTPNRNYFMTGENSGDFAGLIALVDAGMMTKRVNAEWLGGGFFFAATDLGQEYALSRLPAPKEPKKKSRYEEFLDADCGFSFGEWLVIDLPKREFQWNGRSEWTYRFTSRRGTGEWCKTLKEAKASYKAAIKQAREQRKEWEKAKMGSVA